MAPMARTLVVAVAAAALAGPVHGQFTDVTASSGIGAIVEATYDGDPDWWLSGLHFVDLDGDGDLDLFLSAHTGGAVATVNSGAGQFSVAAGNWPDSEIHLHTDLDRDGRVDLSMTHSDGGGRWWRNLSTPGSLDFEPFGPGTEGNQARSQVLLDLDGDGFADWLRGAPPGLVADFGDGDGGFEPEAYSMAIPGTGPNDNANFLPLDLEGDGDLDLLAMVGGGYEDTDGRTFVYRRTAGPLAFVDATAGSGLPVQGTVVKGVGDFDQDGDPDLIAVAGRAMPPVLWRNDGDGTFTLAPAAISGVPPQSLDYSAWGTAVSTDFDNDGVADLLMNGKYYLKLLRGTGGGSFAYMNQAWGITDTCACSIDDGLAFGDLDADGDLDLVGYDEIWPTRTLRAYRNDLPARSWVRVRPVGRRGNTAAAGATIRIFAPGTQQLLWHEQVAVYCFQAANSYYGRPRTERHFGLGARSAVDVEVRFHPSGVVRRVNAVSAGSTITIDEGLLFADGFESGTTGAWSATQPRGALSARPARPAGPAA